MEAWVSVTISLSVFVSVSASLLGSYNSATKATRAKTSLSLLGSQDQSPISCLYCLHLFGTGPAPTVSVGQSLSVSFLALVQQSFEQLGMPP